MTLSRSLVALALSTTAGFSACSSSSNSTPIPGTTSSNQTSAGATSPPAQNSCTLGASALTQDHGKFMTLANGTPSTLKLLHGHVPRQVAEATDQGKTNENQSLSITLALAPNNVADLNQQLMALYQPGSSSYHQFLTPDEFRAQYGPTQTQMSQVQAFLTASGFQSINVNENGFLVHASATVAKVNAAFHTELHQYQDRTGKTFRAPAYELQIPSELAIQSVHGLHDLTHLSPHLKQFSSSAPGTSKAPQQATGPGGGFSPSDVRSAYNVPTAADGTGQTLAVMELDGYTASDITGFEQFFNLPATPLQNVLVDGTSGSAGGGAAEVTLDIELMIALAPHATSILVYEGPNDDQGILDTYSKIANDNLAKSVSTSWGTSENSNSSSFLQSENTIFMQMAAQGQSIFAAAGDSGAYDDGSSLVTDDPASQPYVTGVGGTTLTTSSNGAYQSETTWNAGSASAGGGGGGISQFWTQPTWQNGLATTANKASSTMRNVPDVSLNADPSTGYAIFYQGGWGTWGGTSCAAPLWAAFTALVNQQRQAVGLGTLGYANPSLYQIGKGSRYTSDFHDIADGSTNLFYPAVTGYDDATGWGSFNGTNLFDDLTANPAPPVTSPAPVSGTGTSTVTTGAPSCPQT